jgi:hypothetical protein
MKIHVHNLTASAITAGIGLFWQPAFFYESVLRQLMPPGFAINIADEAWWTHE